MKSTTITTEQSNAFLTMRSTAINTVQYVSVEDVIDAFNDYPYHQVMAYLQQKIQDSPAPIVANACARFRIWSTPISHAVMVKLHQSAQSGTNLTLADAIVLDLLLSAAYQQVFLGTVSFFHLSDEDSISLTRQKLLQSKVSKTFPSTVTLDLEPLASALYPGAYTQARWESRMRWIQNIKKHAGSLVSAGYLSSASPRAGEVGRSLQVELSESLCSLLADSLTDTPLYISAVPCLSFRIGRGSARQLPVLYVAYRLLYTSFGVKYGTVFSGVSRELSFTEFYEATGLPSYEEWSSQNVLIANPTRYCESLLSAFKQTSALMTVQMLYQEQKVLVTPQTDVYVSQM